MSISAKWQAYGVKRLRQILIEAPWSNHDLLIGIILVFVGIAFLIDPYVLSDLRSLKYLKETGTPIQLGGLFLGIGFFTTSVTLWCERPPFWLRLVSRMAGGFVFCLLALSSIKFRLLSPATITYIFIAIWSVWGILRTKTSGR